MRLIKEKNNLQILYWAVKRLMLDYGEGRKRA